MSLVIPHTFVGGAGNKARASEVNANFAAVAAKFTEGSGGIKDEDIYTSAGIKGSKLSSTAGNRITQAQLEDDAVDLRVLKDDATAGAPAAAVNSANHIKDAIITNAKLVDATLKKGKLGLASTLVTIPSTLAGSTSFTDTTLVSTSAYVLDFQSEYSGTNPGGEWQIRLHLDTATNKYWLMGGNQDSVARGPLNVRVHYLQI